MENGTEQCGIDLCTYFIRCFQSGHMTVIESQAAIQIGIQGRWRERERLRILIEIIPVQHAASYCRRFLDRYLPAFLRRLTGFKEFVTGFVWPFYKEL